MQNILVFYGGKSVEHDISVITAIQTLKNINTEKYNVIPIYQTRENEFVVVKDYLNPKVYCDKVKNYKKVEFVFGKSEIKIKGLIKKTYKIDCAINCLHGLNGEDGTLSALMNLCNIPISSSGLLGSSVCMDKILMKDIFRANNIPCVEYTYLTNNDYEKSKKDCLNNIENKMKFPVIVKPSNLGSSIGITKANNMQELEDALDIAFCYDKRVIIEKCLENFKEINISCIGNEDCDLSSLEQPINWQDFLNFENKYQNNNETKTKILNPNLNNNVIDKIKSLSNQMFKIFDLSGVVRIDFMVDEQNNVFVNEINTVPGSLAFYLWKDKNIELFELIDKLIVLAKEKHKQNKLHKYNFSSTVLQDYKGNQLNKYSK